MSATYTTAAEFQPAYDTLFATFATHKTKSLAWRKWQLKQAWWLIEDNEELIVEALGRDLNRHPVECYAMDIRACKAATLEHIKHLEEWAADIIPNAGLLITRLGRARIRKEPLGVALVIGSWNFPLMLVIQPMLCAIAAGCCVMLKPSEVALHTQNLVAELVPKYMDQSAIRVVTGGPVETAKMLEHKFNHIFYTGSSKVARHISAAAATHLTPMVLELGGQGPAIVTRNADVDVSAKRIALVKFLNAGQICLSVNHIFADPFIYDEFVERLKHWTAKFRGGNDEAMVTIVNKRNYQRLSGLLERTSGQVSTAGAPDSKRNFFPPTVVSGVKLDDSLLSEELFGPIAPVVEASVADAITSINNMPHPLGISIFSKNRAEIEHILNSTLSGGVTVNDAAMHAAVPDAPFGGVGESGYGSYHGRYGVDAFSHLRTVVESPLWLERLLNFRCPPYSVDGAKKFRVKNNLGFKRGETLEDQHVGGVTSNLMLVLQLTGLLILLRLFDQAYLHGRLWEHVTDLARLQW